MDEKTRGKVRVEPSPKRVRAYLVLGDAENPHLGGVHDPHGKSGISGVIVGEVPSPSARCRTGA